MQIFIHISLFLKVMLDANNLSYHISLPSSPASDKKEQDQTTSHSKKHAPSLANGQVNNAGFLNTIKNGRVVKQLRFSLKIIPKKDINISQG